MNKKRVNITEVLKIKCIWSPRVTVYKEMFFSCDRSTLGCFVG